jgi:hypothetical protein
VKKREARGRVPGRKTCSRPRVRKQCMLGPGGRSVWLREESIENIGAGSRKRDIRSTWVAFILKAMGATELRVQEGVWEVNIDSWETNLASVRRVEKRRGKWDQWSPL